MQARAQAAFAQVLGIGAALPLCSTHLDSHNHVCLSEPHPSRPCGLCQHAQLNLRSSRKAFIQFCQVLVHLSMLELMDRLALCTLPETLSLAVRQDCGKAGPPPADDTRRGCAHRSGS